MCAAIRLSVQKSEGECWLATCLNEYKGSAVLNETWSQHSSWLSSSQERKAYIPLQGSNHLLVLPHPSSASGPWKA